MSDELPSHIQEAIMKRLPVKSLLQFRSVSKAWKSLIDNSKFIAAHSIRNNQPQHLFVKYTDGYKEGEEEKYKYGEDDRYVSFVDDDCFPQQRFVPTLPLPIRHHTLVGSSYGLLCIEGYPLFSSIYGKRMAVLLNPSIRKSVAIALPDLSNDGLHMVLGFGVCPVTLDPKIIQISQISWENDLRSEIGNFWEVNIYTLSSGKFTPLSSNLPSISIYISRPQVVIDSFIYWCAVDSATVDGVLKTRNLIMSFNITNENFGVVDLPNSIAINPLSVFSVSKLRESLVMLEYNISGYEIFSNEQIFCIVWMMEHGVGRSFTKLYTIKAPDKFIKAVGFRNTGGPIMEVQDDNIFESTAELVVYEPNSEQSNHLIIGSSFSMNSYIETLLLLGHPDCSSY